MPPSILIDPELSGLLTPLTPAEAALLEAGLAADGCRDPLVVWAETGILLDGHHRHLLCTRLGIPFTVRTVSLPDRRAAVAWRLNAQLSRRNLSPLQASYFRGRLFESLKRPGSRTDRTSGQSVARSLGRRYGIDPRTLTRDAAFARSLDALAVTLGAEFRTLVLTRKARLTRREVVELATRPPAEQRVLARERLSPRPSCGPPAGRGGALAPGDYGRPPAPTPDLHAAWESAAPGQRADFLARPDVLALAADLLAASAVGGAVAGG